MKALGSDFSRWNDNNYTPTTVDFVKGKAQGLSFVFIKASQYVVDEDFFVNWNNAKSAGLLRGAYHYLAYDMDVLKQAQLFVSLIQNDPGELPPVVDFEQATTLSKVECERRLRIFVDYVYSKIKKHPIIYTGYFYWNDHTDNGTEWANNPLWLAWYTNNEANIKIPKPWKKYTFWQFTDKGDGIKYGAESTKLDMNWFNGTEEELYAFANMTMPIPPPDPEPEPPVHPAICPTCGQAWGQPTPDKWIIVNGNPYVYMTIGGQILGYLMKGTQVVVDYSDSGYSHLLPVAGFPDGGLINSIYVAKI